MKVASLILFVLLGICGIYGLSQEHALLVAGSKFYGNYRHQADVYHSFQIVKSHGIPESNIVVMHYDDIAYNKLNPFKGNVINQPNGPNVYIDIPKDYTRENVTSQNFLAVLRGDSNFTKGRKVLQTNENSTIFINLVDHGSPGQFEFPGTDWSDDFLTATDLVATLKQMWLLRKYKEVVIYVESCESGSMFNMILPNNIKVFATTAADPYSSSWGCYYDKQRRTYLGDVYSVNWMQNSDVANFYGESIHQQYALVKKETNTSHVCEYGDHSVSKNLLYKFLGNKMDVKRNLVNRAVMTQSDPVPSRRIDLIQKIKNLESLLVVPLNQLNTMHLDIAYNQFMLEYNQLRDAKAIFEKLKWNYPCLNKPFPGCAMSPVIPIHLSNFMTTNWVSKMTPYLTEVYSDLVYGRVN